VLDIEYEPFGKPTVGWRFHPHILKRFNGRWFCVGYNQTGGFWKTVIALDRIRKVSQVSVYEMAKAEDAINRRYRVQDFSEGENWQDHFFNVIGSTVRDEPVQKVHLRIEAIESKRAFYVHTKPLHHTQKPSEMPVPDSSGWCEFTVEVIPNNEFYAALLALGHHVEVVSPQAVVHEMRRRVLEMAGLYGQ
jgi:predicted DNA-binding transcriptional regulator YafY